MIRRLIINFVLLIALASCNLIPGVNSNPPTATSPTQTTVAPTFTSTSIVETPIPPTTETPTPLRTATPTETPASSPTPTPSFAYNLQVGSPAIVANFLHPDAGCNYTGIGGQVFGRDGKPIQDQIVVKVTGVLQGRDVEFLAVTGGFPALGPGGYEITLSDHIVASNNSLFLQLFDLSGIAQSPLISFNTFSDCTKNLVVLNFVEASLVTKNYIPIVVNK